MEQSYHDLKLRKYPSLDNAHMRIPSLHLHDNKDWNLLQNANQIQSQSLTESNFDAMSFQSFVQSNQSNLGRQFSNHTESPKPLNRTSPEFYHHALTPQSVFRNQSSTKSLNSFDAQDAMETEQQSFPSPAKTEFPRRHSQNLSSIWAKENSLEKTITTKPLVYNPASPYFTPFITSPQFSDRSSYSMSSIWGTPDLGPIGTPFQYGLSTPLTGESKESVPSALYNLREESITLLPSSMIDEAESTQSRSGPMHFTTFTSTAPIVQELTESNFKVDKSKLTDSFFAWVSRDCEELVKKLRLSEDGILKREISMGVIRVLAEKIWKDSQVGYFGMNCGVDVSFTESFNMFVSVDDVTLKPIHCVERLGQLIKQVSIAEMKMMTRLRVPILKLREPISNIKCQIDFQNKFAKYNTDLLRLYTSLDARVRELFILVSYWSNQRKINEPHNGTLSEFCYMLMIINFLQIRGVLPVLQNIRPESDCSVNGDQYDVNGRDVYYFKNLEELGKYWTCSNFEQIGELLVAFFKFYAAEFPVVHGVVSVRVGKVLSKDEKGWTRERQQSQQNDGTKSGRERFWFCVEDPFDIDQNIARTIDKDTLFKVRGEFIRASKYFCEGIAGHGYSVLEKVCESSGV
ncbi:hypothetical protein HK098_006124 [Nowakowskiella sp. JEL0407]|nr:hypothetical protein HK098_006124 [Nowakowskiella sp. JEL0407]